MKKVLALTFLVFVALDITVCLQEHRLEKECCGMMASSELSQPSLLQCMQFFCVSGTCKSARSIYLSA